MSGTPFLPGDAALPPSHATPARRWGQRGRRRSLSTLWPSAAIEADYRKRLLRLINEMAGSVVYWVTAAYRRREPEAAMAMDDFASTILAKAMSKLRRLWYKRFDQASDRLARYFAQSVAKRTDEQLKKILREGGMSVEFKATSAQRDVMNAVVHANVSLIKTIPRKYLSQVEGMVMRSVATGKGIKELTDDLHATFYASRKYAAFVALDQNCKTVSALRSVRELEAGIKQGVWMHSHAGREPRPTHVKAGRDKVKFDLAQGWWDPHEQQYILPGQLIRCRCSWKPVVPGFS